jgi:hypothetical protein
MQSASRALRLLQWHDGRRGAFRPSRAGYDCNDGADMRQIFQGAVLAVAVGVQMVTFYSVLYA